MGGWADSGVDPADFSHGLCSYMARSALDFASDSGGKKLKPRQLMEAGYSAVTRDKGIHAGGSTACVAVARSDGFLEVAKYASLSICPPGVGLESHICQSRRFWVSPTQTRL